MTALGAVLAIIVGLVLGLLGGGGGVLTVPILVYGLHLPVKAAVPTSLCVVGLVAVIGFLSHLRQGNVAPRVAMVFAPFAVAAAFTGARIARYIPSDLQLGLFAVVGLVASFFMLRGRRVTSAPDTYTFDARPKTIALLGIQAVGVGLLTGVIGIGGGFLIVPALVLVAKLPMRLAIGTSLLVITMNALGGFAGYLGHAPIDWRVVGWFTAFAAVGSIIGSVIGKRVPQATLRQVFGVLLIGVSLYVLYRR
jgi:uncharacterized membrane protein YfcA